MPRRPRAPSGLLPFAGAVLVFGLARELWYRYLPAYLRALGASALVVGAFGALSDFLDAAYALPGGAASDRLGHNRALVLFGWLTAAGFAVYFFSRSVAAIFAGLLLVEAFNSLGLPAVFSLIGARLEQSKRVAGFTAQSVLRRIPTVLAPPVGGLLLERAGMFRGMRIGFAASAVASVAMLFLLSRTLRRSRAALEIPGDPPSRGKRAPLHPVLKRLLVADCLVRLCEGLPDVFLVVWALEVLHLSPAQFGVATSVLMATAIASYFPAAALGRRVEKKPFVVATFLFFTLFPIAVLAARSFAGLVAAFVVGGLREIGEPSRKALIVDLAPASARGRTVGAYYAIRGFTVAGAAAAGGALWSIRPSLTFTVAAALGAAGTLWAAIRLPASPVLGEEVVS